MELNIQRIRIWPEKNKIFFETITASALLAMAVIVSCQANRIASNQLLVARSECLPFFHFEIDRRVTGHTDLVIYNEGSKLSELDVETYVFLRIDYDQEGKCPLSVRIPIIDYYSTGSRFNQTVGQLVRLPEDRESGGNAQKIAQLRKEFDELSNNKMPGFGATERYVWLRYKNILGEFQEEMFYVTLMDSHKLSKSEEKNILKEYNNKVKQQIYVDLSNASAELLCEKWKLINRLR